ncbi:hypothetical protein CYMTET_18039 [Cymbomonas tetramitiformis]|uniref:Uncharacterized protein n=1 Tax=Cymbomonas tetramitiformis TaxID=36881 RepID=A0AAE0L6B2_9CHLO|nr:hypothetical protein CYMTET_18039 [Cymbomonas tetramitiformis]
MGTGISVKEEPKSWATNANKMPPGNSVPLALKYWVQCTFEGGRNCRHEDYKRQKGPAAVMGLHSNWITKDVLGMARPNDKAIREHGIVDQFVDLGIEAIVNLQELGEHPTCGEGITSGGFSYTPESFMARGVHHYNFSWRDMTCPSLGLALDIVQVIAHHCIDRKRRCAVHCHAGLGRTGLIIACYLVYAMGMGSQAAIQLVRKQRPGSLQVTLCLLRLTGVLQSIRATPDRFKK